MNPEPLKFTRRILITRGVILSLFLPAHPNGLYPVRELLTQVTNGALFDNHAIVLLLEAKEGPLEGLLARVSVLASPAPVIDPELKERIGF
jgi:hypothetical protein